MKAKITYNLPEDNLEYHQANRSANMAMVLWDIDQHLRKADKYETGETIEQLREEFYAILTRYDINMDKLIE